MDLTVVDNTEHSRFEARTDDGTAAGWLEYTRTAQGVTLDHTEVDDRFGGQGVGSTLVRTALESLLAEDITVVNECPFIESYIQRHEGEFDAVVREASA